MHVPFTPEQESRLQDLASQSGLRPDEFVLDLIADLLNREEAELAAAVQVGLNDVSQGRVRPAREALAQLRAKFELPRPSL